MRKYNLFLNEKRKNTSCERHLLLRNRKEFLYCEIMSRFKTKKVREKDRVKRNTPAYCVGRLYTIWKIQMKFSCFKKNVCKAVCMFFFGWGISIANEQTLSVVNFLDYKNLPRTEDLVRRQSVSKVSHESLQVKQSADFSKNSLVERRSIPWRDDGFDPNQLLKKDLPEHFTLNHLVSFGMFASSSGLAQSGGTYLSIMRYDISPNLSLSAAIGFSTLFFYHAPDDFAPYGETLSPELRIPYIALDYRITDNVRLHVQIGDGSGINREFFPRRKSIFREE